MKLEDWVIAVRNYIGVPYAYGGRNKYGMDCVGLVIAAAIDCKLVPESEFAALAGYGDVPDSSLFFRWLPKHLESTKEHALGNIVAFSVDRAHIPRHLGIITGRDKYDRILFTHVCSGQNKRVIESRLTGIWSRRIVSVWSVSKHFQG